MKNTVEKMINEKQMLIEKNNDELTLLKGKLKQLTFDEYEIEDYVIVVAQKIKLLKENNYNLQHEIYQLQRILKAGD